MSNTGQLRQAVERMHGGTATLDDTSALPMMHRLCPRYLRPYLSRGPMYLGELRHMPFSGAATGGQLC
jgi:hypothetical protein